MEIWTSSPVGPIVSPSRSCKAIIRYPVWMQRIGRQYSATVVSPSQPSSLTRKRTSANCGHVTSNCFVSFQTGLNPLFVIVLVRSTFQSAAMPCSSICNRTTISNLTVQSSLSRNLTAKDHEHPRLYGQGQDKGLRSQFNTKHENQ